ncbi:hypothetical protein PHYPSEUDO_010045 [Phytophthora pseudosyringae]|uniref:Uncharacterized protein n=1 Tax=Phytophthora pseudosyringae TaxID=221518 RepID=A0A8T1WA87_9STRA|nr:hypothetical protein PHYPSEUDO_010045 [Phytophthora pseudosyringae]
MSTTPQKQETQELHEEHEQTSSPPTPPSVENQTQDTETEEEAMATKDEEHEHKDEKLQEEEEEKTQEEEVQTPSMASPPVAKHTPTQAFTSASKRKFDALHARNAAGDASISENEKNKKARASAWMKTPGTKKAPTKTRDFSFARPTASSASRTAALARDHAQAKATPTPPPARKPLHPKRTPAKVPRASESALRTPAMTDKASRPHVSYTPYTGPLPPLTVESSFAPKGSQSLDRGARTASPAKSRIACKPRPASAKKAKPQGTTGKENNGVTTEGGAATNAAASIKASRTPIKSSTTGSPVSKEQNRSAFEEKATAQLLASQQAASPVLTPTATVEPAA